MSLLISIYFDANYFPTDLNICSMNSSKGYAKEVFELH